MTWKHVSVYCNCRECRNADCICRKYGVDPDCPIHGRPGQLSLEPDEPADDRYDPSTAEIPY